VSKICEGDQLLTKTDNFVRRDRNDDNIRSARGSGTFLATGSRDRIETVNSADREFRIIRFFDQDYESVKERGHKGQKVGEG